MKLLLDEISLFLFLNFVAFYALKSSINFLDHTSDIALETFEGALSIKIFFLLEASGAFAQKQIFFE